MPTNNLSDEQIKGVLLEFNWHTLIGKKPEFIVSMIVKKLRKSGLIVTKTESAVRVKVCCVTKWDKSTHIKHDYEYVYQQWEGMEGDLIKIRTLSGIDFCVVSLSDGKGNTFTTEILKTDIEIVNDGKEKT